MTRDNSPNEDDEQTAGRRAYTSRRRFLEATGVAGLVGGVGGFAMAQQDSPTTYEFGGRTSAWVGRSPQDIEGESNPTVELEPGTEYEFTWENVDGAPHNIAILDGNGNVVERTEIISEEGATQTLTFTASEEMETYYCQVHPTSMRGQIQMAGAGTPTEGTATPQQQQRYVPQGPAVGAQKIADGPLVNPVTLRSVPGMQDTHVIADQAGQLYLHQNGELQSDPILDISDRLAFLTDAEGGYDRAEGFDERGLLGLAFHPNFQENGKFYLRYSADETGSQGLVGPGNREMPENWDHIEVLAEFQMSGGGTEMATPEGTDTAANATQNGNETSGQNATPAGGSGQLQADPESERVLLEVPEPQFNHNAGEVLFGPDGYLYTTLGDGGGANDTGVGHVEDWYDENDGGNGQDVTENLLGSVLRIDVDQEGENTPYAIPDDNPLVDMEDAFDEHYAWGLRNPWRASFNDGQLITADVGQTLFEEVDVIQSGGNYGWNVREGFHCFNADDATNPPEQCPTTAPNQAPYNGQELLDPVLEYPHTYEGSGVGISITGGYVYQGEQLSQLSGQYVFGDWSVSFAEPRGRVFVAMPQEGAAEVPPEAGNQTAGNQTTGNATGAQETETEIGNVSVGQEAEGTPGENETAGNATNETAGEMTETETQGAEQTATEAPTRGNIDLMQPSEQPWPFQEVTFEGGENQELNRFISAFGRDDQGNVYVLASRTGRLTSEAGEVYRLVPAGEGEEISQPEIETPSPEAGGAENETTGNETNATAANGNETADNETAGNETNGE